MKKLALLIVLTSVAWGWTISLSQNLQTPAVGFIIVGDEGGFASADQKAVASAMAKESERIKARFIVTVGDNFHENGITTATDPRWKTEFEEVYAHPWLQIPWYPSPGNHDYRGSVDAELEYSHSSQRWKFTSRYYTQNEVIDDSASLLIVHLDTSPFINQYKAQPTIYHMEGQDPKVQLLWLDSVLTASHARWKIVVGHHPIYSSTPKGGNTDELIAEVLPILKAHGVPLYVAGHQHFLQHLKRDEMDFVVSGGGAVHGTVAQSREDVEYGAGVLGFASVWVSAHNLQLNFVDTSNALLHTVRIDAPPIR
jgi:acid phosphatase